MIKKILAGLIILASLQTQAQINKTTKKSGVDVGNRDNEHIQIQFGTYSWSGAPDSIKSGGFSRTFNAHLFKDFMFKTDNRFSVAIGVGVGSDHFVFDNKFIDLNRVRSPQLRFPNIAPNTYEKSKVAITYLEAPVELRFAFNPLNYNKSIKIAIGGKVGQLVDVHSKQRTKTSGLPILKEKDRSLFNRTRLALTGRINYGFFGLFASYQFNNFIKDGQGFNDIKPFSIGLSLNGL
jgi:hypothetical protein